MATGDGTQIRDPMYVADVAHAFAAVLDSTVIDAVNLAPGEGRRCGRSSMRSVPQRTPSTFWTSARWRDGLTIQTSSSPT